MLHMLDLSGVQVISSSGNYLHWHWEGERVLRPCGLGLRPSTFAGRAGAYPIGVLRILVSQVAVNNFSCRAVGYHIAVVEPDHTPAQRAHSFKRVRHKNDGDASPA